MARSNVPEIPAERVVSLGRGAVEADGHAGQSDTLELVDRFRGQQRGRAGADVGAKAELDAAAHRG